MRHRSAPRIVCASTTWLLLTAVLLFTVACERKSGGATDTTGDILVGFYGSLTGDGASFGQSSREGAELAVDELNAAGGRSEEHTSELQSRLHLVCRLLLEK